MATDHDCWHEVQDDVTVDPVVAVGRANKVLAPFPTTRPSRVPRSRH